MSEALRHIAIITDGNGRWATRRGRPRLVGHDAGVAALDRTIDACLARSVGCLSVFAFSQENWKRPATEIANIFGIIKRFLCDRLAVALEKGVRIKVIGDRGRLDPALRGDIAHAELATAACTRLTLVVAVNYSGRWDIVQAANKVLADCDGTSPPVFDERTLASRLATSGIPEPDLLIRTAGEFRLSNFLLWQSAYAELFFCGCPWPDFGEKDLDQAIAFYRTRQRTFGGVPQRGAP